MQSHRYQDRLDIQPDGPHWWEFSFWRVFAAICITLLILLAFMTSEVNPAIIRAAAGLSGY
jgi:hypothetical protein